MNLENNNILNFKNDEYIKIGKKNEIVHIFFKEHVHDFKINYVQIFKNPDIFDSQINIKRLHFQVKLSYKDNCLISFFSIKQNYNNIFRAPTTSAVLNDLFKRAEEFIKFQSYEEWLINKHYDLDSSKSQAIYNSLVTAHDQLIYLLGESVYLTLLEKRLNVSV